MTDYKFEYERADYGVFADHNTNEYVVLNKETGIEELRTPILIEARSAADQFVEVLADFKAEERKRDIAESGSNVVTTIQ